MIEDVTPSLIESVKEEFNRLFEENKKIKSLYVKVRDGTATYTEANKFSVEVGNILAKSYKLKLSSAVLPDGKMYFNIADRLIRDTLGESFEIVKDYTKIVQDIANKELKLGIQSIIPDLNESRIEGIIERLATADLFDDIAWILDDPIINFLQSVVDDFVQKNLESHEKLGFKDTITRTCVGRCCKWCKSLAGVYDYETVKNAGNDIYRKHENCRCEVTPNFTRKMVSRGNAFIRG